MPTTGLQPGALLFGRDTQVGVIDWYRTSPQGVTAPDAHLGTNTIESGSLEFSAWAVVRTDHWPSPHDDSAGERDRLGRLAVAVQCRLVAGPGRRFAPVGAGLARLGGHMTYLLSPFWPWDGRMWLMPLWLS